jgi:hypothetical protein
VLHIDTFFYDGIKFEFHEGSGKYYAVTLTPSSTGSGPFIHLSDGKVVDVSDYTEEEHLPLLEASKNDPDKDNSPVVRRRREHGDCEFVDGKLASTRFNLNLVGLIRGLPISLTASGNQLHLSDDLKYPEVKAAFGEPDRIVPYGSQAPSSTTRR